MKQNIIFVLALCMLLITCSDSNDPIKEVEKKDPFISLKKSNIDFTNEGGSEAILIESNVTWTAKSSASWCTITPSSGNKSTESITLSAPANKNYDSRSCMVTIESGGISKTVTVSQSQENAIILSEKDLDLSSKAQSVEVEVKTNIDYEIIIPEDAKHWVSHSKTRALRTETVVLDIAENKNDKMRITKIQINDKSTSLQETITINQRSNVPGVYWVSKMGTLGSLLNQTQKDTITTMIVKGEINKADFDVMKLEMPKLKYIDLKEVKCEGDKIPDSAFGGNYFNNTYNKFINTIILPKSITAIGEDAFANCRGLTGNLILPGKLSEIEKGAFNSCSGFTDDLIISDRVTTIGNSAFSYCTGFTGSLILPDRLTTIGSSAFHNCTGFTGNLIIPESVTTIGLSAFERCSGFKGNLILPDRLTTIGSLAFFCCSGFTGDLIIPDGFTTIGGQAFSGCSGFTGLILPDGLTEIGGAAFEGCAGFTSLILPDGLTTIEGSAFSGCSGFTGKLIIPDGVTTIGYKVFNNCSRLTGLTIGKNLITIDKSAFYNCRNITGNVVFPASLASIRNYAFNYCNKVDIFQFPHTTPLGYYPGMLPDGATIKVPTSAVATYKAANGWKDYNIVGY